MEEPTRNSTFKGARGEARRDNEYQVRERGYHGSQEKNMLQKERSGQLCPVYLQKSLSAGVMTGFGKWTSLAIVLSMVSKHW